MAQSALLATWPIFFVDTLERDHHDRLTIPACAQAVAAWAIDASNVLAFAGAARCDPVVSGRLLAVVSVAAGRDCAAHW
jgi:hypothetical protein